MQRSNEFLCRETDESSCRQSSSWVFNMWSLATHKIEYNTTFPIVGHLNNITLTNRRNQRLTFVRQNWYKVGLNCVKNRMRSISNVIDKAWLDLSEKSYKLQYKICVIQSSLESLWSTNMCTILTFKNVLYYTFVSCNCTKSVIKSQLNMYFLTQICLWRLYTLDWRLTC